MGPTCRWQGGKEGVGGRVGPGKGNGPARGGFLGRGKEKKITGWAAGWAKERGFRFSFSFLLQKPSNKFNLNSNSKNLNSN